MTASRFQAIDYSVGDGVASIVLNRPARKNAIDMVMRAELGEVIGAIRADRDIRTLILSGAGKDFCAGGDIGTMQGGAVSAEAARNRMADVHLWVEQLLTLDKPVIAAGAGLALAADFILAAPGARFCMSFMRMGLVPDCGIFHTLPRVVGLQRAKELIFSAREVGAEEARALGMVFEIVPEAQLAARARELAHSLGQASPAALSLAKRALNASPTSDLRTMLELEACAQGIARSTDYHRDATERFLNKTPLAYSWPGGADPGCR